MRQIFAHCGNRANDEIKIFAADERGSGNANHIYKLFYGTTGVDLFFQDGPIKEAGINGITNEALLAVVMDRLEGFQMGKFSCLENQAALEHVRKALEALHDRTKKRLARGVEGTHQV